MPNGVKHRFKIINTLQNTTSILLKHATECPNPNGRIGMLVPGRSCSKTFAGTFRTDFVAGWVDFDFLAEFGYDILDNAMVGTVGTVIRTASTRIRRETFIRLHDVPKGRERNKVHLFIIRRQFARWT